MAAARAGATIAGTMIAPPTTIHQPRGGRSRRRAREFDVVLHDGSMLHVRPVRDDDGPAMRAFFGALSPESIRLRFFGAPSVEWAAEWAIGAGRGDRCALVATSGPQQAIVAHGAYVRGGDDRAEVAFVVADAWQGRGVATIMLALLAALAREQGVALFTAEVLSRNHRMLDVFAHSGFPVALRYRGDSMDIRFPTSAAAPPQLD